MCNIVCKRTVIQFCTFIISLMIFQLVMLHILLVVYFRFGSKSEFVILYVMYISCVLHCINKFSLVKVDFDF